jgi:putative ABC transport system ATP-binding protein
MTPALSVKDLTVAYDSAGYVVRPLDGLSFEVEAGELVVLLGPSGCGKTTLLSCLAAILTPTSGEIVFGDVVVSSLDRKALAHYRRHIVGIVFQAFNLIPSLTAKGNVMTPLRLTGVGRRDAAARADELLARVGLDDRTHHRPGSLSGGQQQRVAIARALVHDPPLVLADEPTAHLDHIQVEGILRLVRELAGDGRTVIVSTHDDRVTNLADRVIELSPKFAPSEREPELVALQPGQVLFRQGELGDLVYVVEDGEIDILREHGDGSEELLTVSTAGNYFGELGPVLGLPRSATARARTAATLTAYTVRRFRTEFPARSIVRGHSASPAMSAVEGSLPP